MRIQSVIKGLLQRVGIDLGVWTPRIGCERYAMYAIEQLLDPATVRTVFDVGANAGQTVDKFLPIFPGAAIWSFEPFPGACDMLRRRYGTHPRVHIEELALSDSTGVAAFQSNEFDQTNSLLATVPEGSAEAGAERLMHTTGSIEVRTKTIDEFCREKEIESIDLLKIDVQGAAHLVLAGAREVLAAKRVRMLYVEVEFFEMYKGEQLFPQIATTLESNGYVLYRLYNLFNPRGRLAWGDAIFVRPDVLDRHIVGPLN